MCTAEMKPHQQGYVSCEIIVTLLYSPILTSLLSPHNIERLRPVFGIITDGVRIYSSSQKKCNVFTIPKFVVTDSEVWCNVITVQYKNVVKSQKYLQA